MYFSQISPAEGLERAAAHERLHSAYAEHQWLWRFFPGADGSPCNFIFRRWDRRDLPCYYVVSRCPPASGVPAWRVQTREYAPRLAAGEQLEFDLRVNPVVTVTSDGKSRRHDVVMQEKKRLLQARGLTRWRDWVDDDKPASYEIVRASCCQWLHKRAERLGFSIDEASLSVEAYQQHRGKGQELRFSTVDFVGTLTVLAPEAMLQTLYTGIGHAKAFGCGLLLVRRAV